MTSQKQNRLEIGHNLIVYLQKLRTGFILNSTEENTKVLNDLREYLSKVTLNTLPYAILSKFVYEDDDEDFGYFLDYFDELINSKVKPDDANFEKLLKILEHLDLAKQQREALFEEQRRKILQIEALQREVNKKTEKVQVLSDQVDELMESNKNMITNFISILGIFAAILMGAFGAIQGFTSLFQYANDIPLGKALILSAVGGSSVIIILFLLLNGISKLTGRPLSNSDIDSDSIMKKHPTLIVVFGLMVFIALSGSALELSKIELKKSNSGWWWTFPSIWVIYFIGVVHTKSLVWKKR